jgi:hypothetical protein
MAKYSREMSVVAKAAGVGDSAHGLAYAQQLPAIQKTRGLVQTSMSDPEAGTARASAEFTNRKALTPRWVCSEGQGSPSNTTVRLSTGDSACWAHDVNSPAI